MLLSTWLIRDNGINLIRGVSMENPFSGGNQGLEAVDQEPFVEHAETTQNHETKTVDLSTRVLAVFAHLPEELLVFGHNNYIHASFKKLSEDFPELFGNLRFGKYGSFYRSDDVVYALGSMRLSENISEIVGAVHGRYVINRESLLRVLTDYDDTGIDGTISEKFVEHLESFTLDDTYNAFELMNTRVKTADTID